MNTPQFTRKNHYVPELILKRFQSSPGKILEYQLLVSAEQIPCWREVSISHAAYRANLYTIARPGSESDHLETWICQQFENPAERVFARVDSTSSLSTDDWRSLARYFALQNQRTPANYIKTRDRSFQELPRLIEAQKNDVLSKLAGCSFSDGTSYIYPEGEHADFPMRMVIEPNSEGTKVAVRGEIISGRKLWLWGLQRALRDGGPIEALQQHKWTILRAPADLFWLSCDNPAVCVGHALDGSLSLGGGWGVNGNELFLPLSKTSLLYTRVGHEQLKPYDVVSRTAYFMLTRLLILNAYRSIYSPIETTLPESIRGRLVDRERYKEEALEWKKFHSEQSQADRFQVQAHNITEI